MRCPVRAECAAHALAVREPYGVWGGLTEDEREELMGRAPEPPDLGGTRTAPVTTVTPMTSMTSTTTPDMKERFFSER
ncbi:hypothetical protein SNARM312S_06834 [Streptomyces narbonensis]